MFKTLFTFVFLVFLSACSEKDSNAKILVIGTSVDNPPFSFYQDGEMVGFDIELGKLLAQKLGRDVKFVDMGFDTLIAALQSKKVDIAIAAITPTEERVKAVDFTRNYHNSVSVLVTSNETDITDLKKLEGQVVGVQLGSSHEQYIKSILNKHIKVEARPLGKVTDLIQELRIHRIAGFVTGMGEASKIVEMNPTFKMITLPDSSDPKAVALPKGSHLTKVIDEIIKNIEADNALDHLRTKWKLS